MKIVVCMKQTFDTEAKITLDANGAISKENVTLVVDPYSEFAVEEGIRIKERLGGEVIILCLGGAEAETAIRQCLAMGADRAVLVRDAAISGSDPSVTVKVLTKALQQIQPDIILGGFKSVDSGSAQVMIRVAERMGLPHVNMVNKLELNDGVASATRELDDGVEIVEVNLPAIITAQQGLAEPRYPSMRGIMQAKKKPIEVLNLEQLSLSSGDVGASKLKVHGYTLPVARSGGKLIEGEPAEVTNQLLKGLREEAKVI